MSEKGSATELVKLLEETVGSLLRVSKKFKDRRDQEVFEASTAALIELYHWLKDSKQYKLEVIRRKKKK